MATTITPATLTVTLTEAISLGGTQYGGTKNLEIANIKEVYKRIVRCVDDTDCTIATFQTATNTTDNAIDLENVKYIRVTNLDASDALQVGMDDEDSDAAYTSVAADSSIIFTGTTVEGGNGGTTLDNATALKVKGAANQQLELFIASV